VLDEILGNATDVPVTEHATDTHGVTLVNFGLFDLLGLQLSPGPGPGQDHAAPGGCESPGRGRLPARRAVADPGG